jgi:hypothetical protein
MITAGNGFTKYFYMAGQANLAALVPHTATAQRVRRHGGHVPRAMVKLMSIKKFGICNTRILLSVRECKPALILQQRCPPLSIFTSLIFQLL